MANQLLSTLKARYRPEEGAVPHSLLDLLHEFGNVPAALLYSSLFIPEFVIVDGSILLNFDGSHDALAERFRDAKADNTLSLSELEASFNRLELPYVFSNRLSTTAELLLLAEQVRLAWESRLTTLFPGKTFVVTVLGKETNGADLALEFFEERH